MKISDELKIIIFFVFGISFAVGALISSGVDSAASCEYRSIGSRINIPYIIGCELFRERWKK